MDAVVLQYKQITSNQGVSMSITVNVVQFGKNSAYELPENATAADVLEKIPNAANLDVRIGGQPVKPAQKLNDNDKLTAAPRQVKQG